MSITEKSVVNFKEVFDWGFFAEKRKWIPVTPADVVAFFKAYIQWVEAGGHMISKTENVEDPAETTYTITQENNFLRAEGLCINFALWFGIHKLGHKYIVANTYGYIMHCGEDNIFYMQDVMNESVSNFTISVLSALDDSIDDYEVSPFCEGNGYFDERKGFIAWQNEKRIAWVKEAIVALEKFL